jgi:enoyl-CoA hydratase/carnithine racemase
MHDLLSEPRGDAHLLTLNRPERRNALTPELARRLAAEIELHGERPEVRTILLTGAGGDFCAGLDLDWVAGLGEPPAVQDLQQGLADCQRAVLAIVRCPVPVVAIVRGLAAGYGLAFAVACDLRVGDPSARFVSGYARLGLVPGGGITFALPRLVGMGRALRLLMGGGTVDAGAACDIGLLDELAGDGLLDAAVDGLVADLSRSPGATLRTIKRLCRANELGTLEQVLSMEGALLVQSLQSEEFRGRLVEYTGRSLAAPAVAAPAVAPSTASP